MAGTVTAELHARTPSSHFEKQEVNAGLGTPSVISAFGRWKEEDQEFETEFTIGLVYIVSSGPEGVV